MQGSNRAQRMREKQILEQLSNNSNGLVKPPIDKYLAQYENSEESPVIPIDNNNTQIYPSGSKTEEQINNNNLSNENNNKYSLDNISSETKNMAMEVVIDTVLKEGINMGIQKHEFHFKDTAVFVLADGSYIYLVRDKANGYVLQKLTENGFQNVNQKVVDSLLKFAGVVTIDHLICWLLHKIFSVEYHTSLKDLAIQTGAVSAIDVIYKMAMDKYGNTTK